MARPAGRRPYDATTRRAAARDTVQAIVAAAERLFFAQGYAATTMPAIARAAGIALDTVYASVGKKPTLFRLLVERAISGRDAAVPAEQREYVQAIRAEPDAAQKLRLYAGALAAIHPRLAPVLRVLQAAAPLDPDLAALWGEIAARRAANLRLLAEDLQASGALRPGLSVAEVGDLIWSLGSPEFYLLLVAERGWSPAAYEAWLGDAWGRLLLVPAGQAPGRRP
jgi:AcrR family transcriptional regulator